MHCLGIDLAWASAPAPGLAALDPGGLLVASTSVVTDDEIADVLARWTATGAPAGGLVAAVDAPLVVPNLTGRRPCEAQVSAAFRRYSAGAYPANRSNPLFAPEPRAARLRPPVRLADRPGDAVSPPRPRWPWRSIRTRRWWRCSAWTRSIPYKLKSGRELPALRASYERSCWTTWRPRAAR